MRLGITQTSCNSHGLAVGLRKFKFYHFIGFKEGWEKEMLLGIVFA